MTRKGEFCRMTAYDIIELKKRGKILSEEQIRAFVRKVTDESASDAQIAAFCMAVLWRGMTDEECFVLTDAMAKSGVCAEKPNVSGVYADKHSTGGVSDSTTLILVPVLASLGVKCAKYSGRGLGHTGGTLDKMESFPNLRVTLSAEEFEKQVDKVGAAIAGQTSATVPADKRMYAVRDVTATVDSIPLIASSVMSKKLASFADVILLDVKYGDGAFMRRPSDAVKLAEMMVRIGTAAGRKIGAAVTCMDVPLGDNIGCNAEVREAVEVLKGKKNAQANEDGIFINQHFAAVIDGATSKSDFQKDRKSSGKWAMELVIEAIKNFPKDITVEEAVKQITRKLHNFYKANNMLEDLKEHPERRLTANGVIYSYERKEIWQIGDCQLKAGSIYSSGEKEIDRIMSEARAAYNEIMLLKGLSQEDIAENDPGRDFIKPFLEKQALLQNNSASNLQYAFPVFDGFDIPIEWIKVFYVPNVNEIIFSSDGYPMLLSSLKDSEQYLHNILEADPQCMRLYKTTKGVQKGNCSFDDRAYLRIRIK